MGALDGAKGRLARDLRPAERVELVRLSLLTVLEACAEAGLRVVVLTPDERVAAWLPAGVDRIAEQAELRGLNAQVAHALGGIDAPSVLVLHADVPLAAGADLRAFVDSVGGESAVGLVESRDGGTNAMLLRPPAVIAPQYGPGSFALHREAAWAAGVDPVVFESGTLSLDLDRKEDVAALLASEEGRISRVGRYLASIGVDRV